MTNSFQAIIVSHEIFSVSFAGKKALLQKNLVANRATFCIDCWNDKQLDVHRKYKDGSASIGARMSAISYSEPGLQRFFFTPIPCTYTSSPLDGRGRNYFFFYMDTQEHAIHPFNSYLLIPEERRKAIGLSWNRTQVLLLHKRPL